MTLSSAQSGVIADAAGACQHDPSLRSGAQGGRWRRNDGPVRDHGKLPRDAAAEARSGAGRADRQDPAGRHLRAVRRQCAEVALPRRSRTARSRKAPRPGTRRPTTRSSARATASVAPPPGVSPEKFKRQHAAVEYLTDHFADAPVWIVACLEDGANHNAAAGASIYPAVQNMVLACRALGLGTTLTNRHMFYQKEVDKALGLPEGVHSFAILPIGYPMGKFGPVKRAPLERDRAFVYSGSLGSVSVTARMTLSLRFHRRRRRLGRRRRRLPAVGRSDQQGAAARGRRRGQSLDAPAGRLAAADHQSGGQLAVQLRARAQHQRPAHPGAARQAARRVERDQRHGLRARPGAGLRHLGADGQSPAGATPTCCPSSSAWRATRAAATTAFAAATGRSRVTDPPPREPLFQALIKAAAEVGIRAQSRLQRRHAGRHRHEPGDDRRAAGA